MARMRIRSIKPEIWQDEKVGNLSPQERLLFLGLITMADDEGRLREFLSAINGHVFPYDNFSAKKINNWLTKLAKAELIERYKVDGIAYISLCGWSDHQKVNRPRQSDLPPPPSLRDHDLFTESSVINHDSFTEDVCPPVRARGSAPSPDPDPRVKTTKEKNQELPARSKLAKLVDEIISILSQCKRLFIERVGIENAVAAHPNGDHLRAARGVVVRASDPTCTHTNAARLLVWELQQQEERQQRSPGNGIKASRKEAAAYLSKNAEALAAREARLAEKFGVPS